MKVRKLIIADVPVTAFDSSAVKGKCDAPVFMSVLFDEEGHAMEAAVYKSSDGTYSRGSIYVGRVEQVLSNRKGAFIRIGEKQTAYMDFGHEKGRMVYCRDGVCKTEKELKTGDVCLVHVQSEALKTKLPRVGAQLERHGRFLVLRTDAPGISYSARLTPEQKKHLSNIPFERLKYRIIFRTLAGDAKTEAILEEYAVLKHQMDEICTYGTSRMLYTCLFQPENGFEALFERLPANQSEVITDSVLIHQMLQERCSRELISLRLYQDERFPLYQCYRFPTLLKELQNKKLYLKSGGSVVIEQTEAFVSIDINSSKNVSKYAAFELNREAADRIFREIRLRQLSGTILIDLVHIASLEEQENLLLYLKELSKKDPVKTTVVDITKLGIAEITRKKQYPSLAEQIRKAII